MASEPEGAVHGSAATDPMLDRDAIERQRMQRPESTSSVPDHDGVVNDAVGRSVVMDGRQPAETYNYEHFRTRHLLEDARRTLDRSGIRPGDPAPDFRMPRADGEWLRLSDLRGTPVLLHFGSYT